MATYLGIYAKKNGVICIEQPIFTDETTSLVNILQNADAFFDKLKTKIHLKEPSYWGHRRWVHGAFTKAQLKALKGNCIHDDADLTIEYAQQTNTELPDDFYAIGMKCNDRHCFVYDPKYLEHENWGRYADVSGGIILTAKIIGERIKLCSHEETQSREYIDLWYDFASINMMYGFLKSVKTLYNPDEIAIIYTQ